jgi:hypothetical protein
VTGGSRPGFFNPIRQFFVSPANATGSLESGPNPGRLERPFLSVDGGFSQLYLRAHFPLALCCRIEAMAAPGGVIMPAAMSDEMAALLRVLENVERAFHQRPVSTFQELAELHKETKLKVANLAAEDRYANPLVERIATAMLKLRNQAQ